VKFFAPYSATGGYTVLADSFDAERVRSGNGTTTSGASNQSIHTMLDEYYSSLYSGDAFGVLKQQLTSKVRQGA
jgi:hypothetical protein